MMIKRVYFSAMITAAMGAVVMGCSRSEVNRYAGSPPDNLFVNPGFESDAVDILPWFVNIHADPEAFEFGVDSKVAFEGKNSLRIQRKREQPFANVVQYFRRPQDVRRPFRLSVWLRGEDVVGEVRLHAVFSEMGGSIGSDHSESPRLSGTFGWTRLDMDIVPPSPRVDAIQAGVTVSGDGTLWIDAAELVPLTE